MALKLALALQVGVSVRIGRVARAEHGAALTAEAVQAAKSGGGRTTRTAANVDVTDRTARSVAASSARNRTGRSTSLSASIGHRSVVGDVVVVGRVADQAGMGRGGDGENRRSGEKSVFH